MGTKYSKISRKTKHLMHNDMVYRNTDNASRWVVDENLI